MNSMMANRAQPDLVTGNHFDKYRSKNPLHRWMVDGFIRSARELLELTRAETILEVGSGPGDLAYRLLAAGESAAAGAVNYVGIDISEEQVRIAGERYPQFQFRTASAYELPFADRSVDLVIACEVLEHLEQPELALAEMARVSRGYALISVPWEPVWRILNVLRGQYWRDWGNTPGHVQHFSRNGLRRLVASRLEITVERFPFPWSMLLARQQGTRAALADCRRRSPLPKNSIT